MAQEVVRQVPVTTCRMEPYCVTVKVCRRVPIQVPVCEPGGLVPTSATSPVDEGESLIFRTSAR
jgi:hypothetical protein